MKSLSGTNVVIHHSGGILTVPFEDLEDGHIAALDETNSEVDLAKVRKDAREMAEKKAKETTEKIAKEMAEKKAKETAEEKAKELAEKKVKKTAEENLDFEIPDQWYALSEGVVAPPEALVVKGLFVGMDSRAAVVEIVKQGKGRIKVRPLDRGSEKGFDILYEIQNGHFGRHGGIRVKDGKVDVFFFEKYLSEYLFNVSDLAASEFAQSFINNYGVPSLEVSTYLGQQGWRYESPHGWTLRIMASKVVDVSTTPTRKFD